jgi:hypothetical protein
MTSAFRPTLARASSAAVIAVALLALPVEAQLAQDSNVVTVQTSSGPSLPEYVVFRHFLNWAAALSSEAAKGVPGDPNAFAKPFSSATLDTHDLAVLRQIASTSKQELQVQDAKARAVIDSYRVRAKAAINLGQSLPPKPEELKALEAGRTALSIKHYVELQQRLSPDGFKRLKVYVSRDFAPHISLGAVNMRSPMEAATNGSPDKLFKLPFK